MGKSVRLVLLGMLVVAATIAALGWLFLVRPHVEGAGPRLPNVLALDALAGHADVALLPFAAVWVMAGALVGLIARAARVERAAAGLVCGLGVGLTLFAATGASILVAQQISAGAAYAAAARVAAIYLAAALAGLGSGCVLR